MKRLKSTFETTPDIVKDLEVLLNYRIGNDSMETYIIKIEKNVEKVMKHKLTSTKLTPSFLKHCLDNEAQKLEIQRYEMTKDLLISKLNKEDSPNDSESDQCGPTQCKYIKIILHKIDEMTEKWI